MMANKIEADVDPGGALMGKPRAFDRAWDQTMDSAWIATAHALTPPGHRLRRVWRWRVVLRVGRFTVRVRRPIYCAPPAEAHGY